MGQFTRRTFIKTAATAVGARAAVAQQGVAGANAAVNVGVIGCGGRAHYMLNICRGIPQVRFVVVSDVYEERIAQAQKVIEPRPKGYSDFRKMLEHPGLDAVMVTTPGHWHVLPAIHACQAGKDVFLEKPVSTSIGEGRALVNAARKHDRIVQVATQQHSWGHYQQAVEIIRSGVLGDISNVHVWDLDNFFPGFGAPADSDPPTGLDWDFWLGPAPVAPFNTNRLRDHYWFMDYGGGWPVDWAVHHYDIVHWAMNVSAPAAATGLGGKFAFPKDNTEWPDTFTGACEYGPGPVAKAGFLLTFTSRTGCNRPIEGRTHGKAFYGSDGVMVLDRSGYQIYSQTRKGKKTIEERSGPSPKSEDDVVRDHFRGFLAALASRKRPPADVEVGHLAGVPGHLMNIALRLGRRVKWDSAKEQIIDDSQAQEYVTRKYRAPWTLPV